MYFGFEKNAHIVSNNVYCQVQIVYPREIHEHNIILYPAISVGSLNLQLNYFTSNYVATILLASLTQ